MDYIGEVKADHSQLEQLAQDIRAEQETTLRLRAQIDELQLELAQAQQERQRRAEERRLQEEEQAKLAAKKGGKK
jgi:hypothetical protein